MKSEWNTIRAADFIDFNPRVILKKGTIATKVAMDKLKPFSKNIPETEKAEFNGGAKFCNGDTVMARITPCLENGKTAFVDILDDGEVGFGSTEFIVMRARPGISDPQFVYYTAINPAFRNVAIQSMVGSSGRQRVQQSVLNEFELRVPDLDEQKHIGAFLANLDEKITLNNNINDNLEEQALTLFRQYFMDYVPYGGIAPSNWTEVSLDEVCTRITDGSHYSPADAPESPYPMYSVKDMETYGFNSSSCKHISEEDFRKMKKNDCIPLLNDILIAKDGSYLKEIFICSEEKDEAILSSIAIFRPDTNIIMPEILLCLLKQPSVRKDVGDNYVSGSALPRIVLKDFKKYRFMLPPMDEQLKIGSVLHTIRMQTKKNLDEIQCLLSARDTLLPRLMSGELDVSDLDL